MRFLRTLALGIVAGLAGFSAYAQTTATPVTPGVISLIGCPSAVLTPCFVPSVPANPTSTLTRPANTTAYSSGQLIASSTTAGSVVVPSFTIQGGRGFIPRLRLSTNVTTGWAGALTVTLWRTAPTYTNGDGGAYAVATGAASRLAQYTCTLTQYGDGAAGECSITIGNFLTASLPSGTSVYWDMQAGGALTPISGQTFTLTAETVAD